MAPKSTRRALLAAFTRRTRPSIGHHLRCERLEDRTTPALFNVTNASMPGLNNNGCVATADFNHDGFADAVLTNFGTDTGSGAGTTITVLYGKSGGGFNKVSLSTGGFNPSFASVVDINGDGWADVLVANGNKQNTGSVTVFQNDGAGNLSVVGSPFSTASNNASWVGAADVTGDGVLDVIVGSFGKDDGSGNNIVGNNITIFQGNADAQGHGNFTFSSTPTTTLAPEIQFSPTALAVADFNGDGFMDIAAVVPGVPADSGQPQPDGSIYLFQGTGSGGFSAPNLFDTDGALPVNVQAADVNGDGKKDLIIANAGDPYASTEFSNNSVGILLNVSTAGSVNFGVPNALTANCHGTFAVAVADFNMDGKQDIASINYGSLDPLGSTDAFVSVYLGTGNGSFNTGSPGTYNTLTGSPGGQYLAVGDLDNNGTPDLITVALRQYLSADQHQHRQPLDDHLAGIVGQSVDLGTDGDDHGHCRGLQHCQWRDRYLLRQRHSDRQSGQPDEPAGGDLGQQPDRGHSLDHRDLFWRAPASTDRLRARSPSRSTSPRPRRSY